MRAVKNRTDCRTLFKDETLAALAAYSGNVAQFVSFNPALKRRFVHVRGVDSADEDPLRLITGLYLASNERSVNVRSFDPVEPESHDFIYGITSPHDALQHVQRLAASGLYTIVNETVDVRDGGVSGVILGNLMEVSPDDTPRCVEKPGVASLPRELGIKLLSAVYGFRPDLDFAPDERVEFSIHPQRRGLAQSHTLIWQKERVTRSVAEARLGPWPNRFSQLLGDKLFGLLVAWCFGLPVPRTTAICRRIPPFAFGSPTGTGETWIRTAPREQIPGRFLTRRGWVDPFDLLTKDDAEGVISSVLAQEGIAALFSGAVVADRNGDPLVEGVTGHGSHFMVGEQTPEDLPDEVVAAVVELYADIAALVGPARFEWAYDGNKVWVLQLHKGKTKSMGRTIVPGQRSRTHRFEVSRGLEELRSFVAALDPSSDRLVLVGRVGLTSHFADVLRRAGVPSAIKPN